MRETSPVDEDSSLPEANRFSDEMAKLRRCCWQFYCLVDELPGDNDFVRKMILGRDVFVQNFNGLLRGFHNICSHRGFPLRCAESGRGIVRCGFHGWVYDADGVPRGIPRNTELFQLDPAGQEALGLTPVRLERVGRFLFVALSEECAPTPEYLSPFIPLLEALSATANRIVLRTTTVARANWKLAYEITLDDYHIQMVHPTTFGAGDVRPAWRYVYERAGWHSSLLTRRDRDWNFDSYWQDLISGIVDNTGYKVHQIFPNLLVSVEPTTLNVCAYRPLDADHTQVDLRHFDWKANPLSDQRVRELQEGVLAIESEDRSAVEVLQATRERPTRPDGPLGGLERRIGWFREAYAGAMRWHPDKSVGQGESSSRGTDQKP